MDSEDINDIRPFYTLLSDLRMSEDILDYIFDSMKNIKTEIESNYQKIVRMFNHREKDLEKLESKRDQHLKIVQSYHEDVTKYFRREISKCEKEFNSFILELKRACKVFEDDRLDKYKELYQTYQLLNRSYEVKKIIFTNLTMMHILIENEKRKDNRLYLGTLVVVKEYLEDYEVDIISSLIRNTDFKSTSNQSTPKKLNAAIDMFTLYRPNLFRIAMDVRVLSNRVYLLIDLAGKILNQAKSKERIEISSQKLFDSSRTGIRHVEHKIDYLQGNVFKGFESLEVLDLSNNRICMIQESNFEGLKKLKELNLSSNKIFKIDEGSFKNLSQLERLDLSSNKITHLDPWLFKGVERLKKLEMKYNNLEKLVDGQFEHLVNLEELDLSQNQLKAIPEMAFHGLDELIKLELNDNHIDKIYSNCFNNLSQLNELYLSRNQLNYIPEETFHGLNKLEQLELDSNDIDRMHSGCFKVFPHLARLNLSSNKIQHLNKVHLFENFKNIALLDLSNNQIGSGANNCQFFIGSPTTVALPNNRKFYFKSALKSMIPAQLLMKNLRTLYLNHNNYTCLKTNMFEGLFNLKNLYMSDNQIVEVQDHCFNNIRLKLLVLTNNLIGHAKKLSFKGLNGDVAKGLLIDLCGNPLGDKCQQSLKLSVKRSRNNIEFVFEKKREAISNLIVAIK